MGSSEVTVYGFLMPRPTLYYYYYYYCRVKSAQSSDRIRERAR